MTQKEATAFKFGFSYGTVNGQVTPRQAEEILIRHYSVRQVTRSMVDILCNGTDDGVANDRFRLKKIDHNS